MDIAVFLDIHWLDMAVKGGGVMIPIFLLSMFSLYLFVERYLYIRQVTESGDLAGSVKLCIEQENLQAALALCKTSNTALARMLEQGMRNMGKSIPEIEKNIEAAGNIEVGKMTQNLGYLGIVAGIAPMLGFVGTILGVIKIFYSISVTENISVGSISGGLYEKMITSGAGLLVGMLAYAGYHFLHMKIEKFALRAEMAVLGFINSLQNVPV
jgi:biopolymer transport protein ExbB